ncbi:BamA/TamA family outer membrane protein [Synechococcus sp. LTW-R]|uniref:BamA/TamA family outer membrane protein n=1 Tax=Synechococcus sp. LTW-R TaxID=2751170 RepID=UPI0016257282|nr:BamA/TamA family outer membrane protein [Synechococcus sp. LTW-R]QNG29709.1 BamA/TamA family outer membrane protein [Synechococcus sp. LTW-R]
MAAPRNGKNHAWSLGLALTLPLVTGVGPVWGQDTNPEPEDPAPTEQPASETPSVRPSLAPSATESLAPAAPAEPRVLISEVVVQGAEGHPEQERMEIAVYDAMAIRPGSRVTRGELQTDLSAIYASGWFSDVRIQPVDSPLGVRLVVTVVPNPVLTKVELEGVSETTKLPENLLPDIFAADYGKTLNLNALQARIAALQKWYADQGYSLARVTGPTRVSPAGVVQLLVREGTVAGVEVQFLNKEGDSTNDKGQPIRGKTKTWVVTREISIKAGDTFNRRQLEDDIKRLYGTGLFGDVKVTLRPVAGEPGAVTIVLGVVEQSTGSLSGGIGYSQSQGIFGQIQLQDSNLFGRAWDLALNVTYGQFGGLADLSFTDPWIKGDKYRTAFRTKVFLSREVPQVFQSQQNGNFYTVSDVSQGFFNAPSTALAYQSNSTVYAGPYASPTAAKAANPQLGDNNNWFQLDGNAVAIQRIGGTASFARPLNGGDPYKKAPWNVVVGLNAQQVKPINFAGDAMPYATASNNFTGNGTTTVSNVICVAYNCENGATTNQLVGLRLAASMNTLNDPRNPTKGNFLSVGTEQFVSVGQDSPTFNRLRASATHYIPVNWLKFYKGCRPKPGQKEDCKQALAFQASVGTNLGNMPVYEAFCLGGSNSVRGYYDCDLGVGKSFGEATVEYRFPIFSIISGEVFVDAGSTFGSQADVPGNPGTLLDKPGDGVSPGVGVIVTTPVGPLRLEVASQDFTDEWRFNLGVGWKF